MSTYEPNTVLVSLRTKSHVPPNIGDIKSNYGDYYKVLLISAP